MNKKVIASLRNVFDGIMVFMLFVGTTVYALPSNGVTYNNSTSGSSATNVGDAIDDLYSKLSIKDNEINRLKGIGNASSNTILSGYTALVQGSTVTGSIPSKGATTYTPGTQDQTIASNQYLSGNQTIKGDANLVSQNIVRGKTIFGVSGTYPKVTRFSVSLNPGKYDFFYDKHKYAFSFKVSIREQYPNYNTLTRDRIYIDIPNLSIIVYSTGKADYYGGTLTTSYDNTTGEIIFTGAYNSGPDSEYGVSLHPNHDNWINVAIID